MSGAQIESKRIGHHKILTRVMPEYRFDARRSVPKILGCFDLAYKTYKESKCQNQISVNF